MTPEALKKKICEAIDSHRPKIDELGDAIMAQPELGFKETQAAKRWRTWPGS